MRRSVLATSQGFMPSSQRAFSHTPQLLEDASSSSLSTTHHPVSTPTFTPRTTFSIPEIRSSYYLGHHQAALRAIESQLSCVNLILECRDMRLPLSSWNPTLEHVLSSTHRLIIYTKSDLITDSSPRGELQSVLSRFHSAHPTTGTPLFWDAQNPNKKLLKEIQRIAISHTESLLGLRVFVVGMPNVGKSTLLNKLRNTGMGGGRPKVAPTANYPGVTRKLSMPVRILGGKDRPQDKIPGEGVFLVDTPGVFMPYVADKEVMLKLALAHGIKEGIITNDILADYLLYKLNTWDPTGKLYAEYSPPTNDVEELLHGVAAKTGKLQVTGSTGDGTLYQAAGWLVARWRSGGLGKYVLEEVSKEAIAAKLDGFENPQISYRQAKKQVKEARKEAWLAKNKGQ